MIDGVYYLTNHGEIIREITEAEYNRLSIAEARLMIGCMLMFVVMPVAHFGIRKHPKQ